MVSVILMENIHISDNRGIKESVLDAKTPTAGYSSKETSIGSTPLLKLIAAVQLRIATSNRSLFSGVVATSITICSAATTTLITVAAGNNFVGGGVGGLEMARAGARVAMMSGRA